MKFAAIARLSWKHVRQRGLRSLLTILGIIIGVAAVVAIVSIGEGLQANVAQRLGGLGSDVLTITPGYERAQGAGFRGGGFEAHGPMGGGQAASAPLTERNVNTVRSVPGVQYVQGTVSGRADLYYLGQNYSLSIQGVDPSVWRFFVTTALESGRYLTAGDSSSPVAVIGNAVARGVFKQDIEVNKQVTLGGFPFRVVGVLNRTDFGGGDRSVYIPVDWARKVLTDIASDQVSSISVKLSPEGASDPQAVIDEITPRLMATRNVNERTRDFTVTSPAAIRETVGQITGTITLFLGGIAAVSLLVGAVGISNTMYTSVLERTRLIGLLKALGTTNGEVMRLFLVESSLYGLVGGLAGVVIGSAASVVMGTVGLRFLPVPGGGGATTVVSPGLILFALTFAMLIGALSGILPARRGSRLSPVEALRYE